MTRADAIAMLPALAFALFVIGLAGTALYAAPETGETAVVFAPSVSEPEAWARVRAAGGYVVAPTAFSNIVVAYAADAGFHTRIASLGALTFAAAPGLCRPAEPSERPAP